MTPKAGRCKSFPLTDSGNAEMIAGLFGQKLTFDHRRKTWLVWKGHRWTEDLDGEVFRLAKAAARERLNLAAQRATDSERQAEAKWALKSESQYCLKVALELAKNESPIADSGENWDSNIFLLGVRNGVVDLETGHLRAARPEDRMILNTGVQYDPAAKCPRFDRFLKEIFCGDAEMISFIWKAIGYSLTGSVSEQCIFLCQGEGANGKSTLLETLRFIFGSYGQSLPFSAFELNARSSTSNDIAGLASKRFATASETSESATLNEARVKVLTGADTCTGRYLYCDFFSFDPTAKFWLAFNQKPRVNDHSYGFWRRIRLIRFPAQFEETGQDKTLAVNLRGEASGILAAAVRGSQLWQREGLGTPPAVREATSVYKKESDHFLRFLEDLYEMCPHGFVTCSELNQTYADWTKHNGETPLRSRDFAARLRGAGCTDGRTSGKDRTRGWHGLIPKEIQVQYSADVRTGTDTKIQ